MSNIYSNNPLDIDQAKRQQGSPIIVYIAIGFLGLMVLYGSYTTIVDFVVSGFSFFENGFIYGTSRLLRIAIFLVKLLLFSFAIFYLVNNRKEAWIITLSLLVFLVVTQIFYFLSMFFFFMTSGIDLLSFFLSIGSFFWYVLIPLVAVGLSFLMCNSSTKQYFNIDSKLQITTIFASLAIAFIVEGISLGFAALTYMPF